MSELLPRMNPAFMSIVTRVLFTPDECAEIVDMLDDTWVQASVTGYRPGGSVQPSIRSVLSQPVRTRADGWPLSAVLEGIASVNDEGYRFDLTGFVPHDEPSVLRYEASLNDHFRPHRDAGPTTATRKLSCVVQLTNPTQYRGGALVFADENFQGALDQGSMIVFPSFLVHQVTPMVEGLRHAIVCWAHGPTFR